jgi:hypothetical protein
MLVLELELELVLADSSRLFLRHFSSISAVPPHVRKIEDTSTEYEYEHEYEYE